MNETEIEAELRTNSSGTGANSRTRPSLPAVRTTASCNYSQNDQVCKEGDLLLLDVAGLGN